MQPNDPNFNTNSESNPNPNPSPNPDSSFDTNFNVAQPVVPAPVQPEQPTQPVAPAQPVMPAQQPIPDYTQPVSPAQSQPVATEDPGKTLSIVGLILAFFVSIAGLIVSIIGRKKSRKAGYSGTIGLIGIIISVISMFFGLLIFIAVMMVAYAGVQEKAIQEQQSAQERAITEQQLNSFEFESGQVR
ncbi:hypothetical protein EOM60_00455 [Candidatus Saccharibacteria bacterium]|nr:hypothetical protein [Candidatus Saccharibacteria bacterium]